jgi:hypothetical protein
MKYMRGKTLNEFGMQIKKVTESVLSNYTQEIEVALESAKAVLRENSKEIEENKLPEER